MEPGSSIYVAGHRGMVGSAIRKKLEESGYRNIIARTSEELDLRRQQDVEDFLNQIISSMYSLQPPEWEASWLTACIPPTSCMTT